MLPRKLAATAALLLLAGCAAPDATTSGGGAASEGTPPVAEGEDLSRTRWTFNATFARHLSEANVGGVRQGLPPLLPVPSRNCLGLSAGARIIAGSANATWTPASAMTEGLLLTLEHGVGERKATQGRSPLSLDLAGLTLDAVNTLGADGFQGSLLGASVPDPAGAAVAQAFELTLWLVYESAEELRVEQDFSCSPMTAP